MVEAALLGVADTRSQGHHGQMKAGHNITSKGLQYSLSTQQRISKLKQHERQRNSRGLSADIESIFLQQRSNTDTTQGEIFGKNPLIDESKLALMNIHQNQLRRIQQKVDLGSIKVIPQVSKQQALQMHAAEKSAHMLARQILHEHDGKAVRKANYDSTPVVASIRKKDLRALEGNIGRQLK